MLQSSRSWYFRTTSTPCRPGVATSRGKKPARIERRVHARGEAFEGVEAGAQIEGGVVERLADRGHRHDGRELGLQERAPRERGARSVRAREGDHVLGDVHAAHVVAGFPTTRARVPDPQPRSTTVPSRSPAAPSRAEQTRGGLCREVAEHLVMDGGLVGAVEGVGRRPTVMQITCTQIGERRYLL